MSARGDRWTWGYLGFWHPDFSLDLEATRAALALNDLDIARLIAAEWSDRLCYLPAVNEWYVWDGQARAPDDSHLVYKIIADYADRLNALLVHAKGEMQRQIWAQNPALLEAAVNEMTAQAWEPWAHAVKTAAGLRSHKARLSVAGDLATFCAVVPEALRERDPDLINVANGTVHLPSGRMKAHDPADRMMHCLDIPYNPGADCPQFRSLLWQVSGHSEPVYWYLIKCLGYCLLGDNREQKIFFLRGPTGSGKSTLLEIVAKVLGQLAHASQVALLVHTQHARNARVENSIRDKRFLTVTEMSSRMRFDAAQLKRLTGETTIPVDQHYAKKEFQATVTFTIFGATNRMGSLVDMDEATKRRVVVIPCGETVAQMDTGLAKRILESESEGILALLITGCQRYFADRHLEPPVEVQMETDLYATEQDTVAQFLDETTVKGEGTWPGFITQTEAWDNYQRWSHGQPQLGRNEFYESMRGQPGIVWQRSQRQFRGVSWQTEWAGRTFR